MADSGGWVMDLFPGDAFDIPSDEERDRADNVLREWAIRWNEEPETIPRTHPETTDEGYANALCGEPTNRAYLRSRLRRWWGRTLP